jgi:hypothetical protein
MVKNLLLINATLRLVFFSETALGSVRDKRMADTTPYPLPARSQLLQALGFPGFILEGVEILQPTKKPRGKELTPPQKADNREIRGAGYASNRLIAASNAATCSKRPSGCGKTGCATW